MISSPNILIVDDTSFNLDLLEILLGQFDLKATRFTSPVAALEYIKQNKIDILLSDYSMPDLNGVEFLAKAHQLQPNIRSAVITALRDSSGEIKSASLAAGALSFLTHPINYHDFQKCIQKLSDDSSQPLYCLREKKPCMNRDKVLTNGAILCCIEEAQEERDVVIDLLDTIEDCQPHIVDIMRCSSKISFASDIINANNDAELKESLPLIKRFSQLIYDFSERIQNDPDIQLLAMSFSTTLKDWLSHKFIHGNHYFDVTDFTHSFRADLSTLEMALGVCAVTSAQADIDEFFF